MEQQRPAVSVIIPVYNVEDYLNECLNSAVKQTLGNIEIICIDDGSTDRSAQIVEEYAQKHNSIRLIRKENGGQSSARNVGLDHARGEYVYFLDSDDYIDHDTLADLYSRACADNLDIICFNCRPFYENERIRNDNLSFIDYYDRKGDYSGVHNGQRMFSLMRENREFFASVCLQLFRRELIEENHLRFYEGIIHEDNLFSFKCMMLAQRVSYTRRAYYQRRVRGESTMTSNQSMKNVQGYIIAYSEMLDFLRGYEFEEDVFSHVSEYLFNSIFGNARRIFYSLDISSDSAVLDKGDFCAAHFLDMIKRSGETQFERSHIKNENASLRRQLKTIEDEYRNSTTYRAGKIVTFLPRLAVNAFRGLRRHGILYGLKAIWLKVQKKLGGGSPLVSIIMPVYNVEEFLEQGLDTLVQQTLKRIEIICVDDGSTDRSLDILNEYAARDNRIKVFTQKNKYAGAARNLGLSHASGEYVVFLDSDDFFARGLAEQAYTKAKLANADVILYGAKHYNNKTGEYREAKWLLNSVFAPEKQPFNYVDCPEIYRITTPCPWTKMFRRQFILDSGLQFQHTQNSNDLFFTYSALAMAKRVVTLDKPLVYYRVGLENNLQSTKKRHPLCFYEAYGAWHDKLVELGVLDTVRQSYVNIALAGCLYNLRTQSDTEAKRTVFDALKSEIMTRLEVTGYEQDYYYLAENYCDMQRVMNGSFEDYMAAQETQ